jgi:hypothetical protein
MLALVTLASYFTKTGWVETQTITLQILYNAKNIAISAHLGDVYLYFPVLFKQISVVS